MPSSTRLVSAMMFLLRAPGVGSGLGLPPNRPFEKGAWGDYRSTDPEIGGSDERQFNTMRHRVKMLRCIIFNLSD